KAKAIAIPTLRVATLVTPVLVRPVAACFPRSAFFQRGIGRQRRTFVFERLLLFGLLRGGVLLLAAKLADHIVDLRGRVEHLDTPLGMHVLLPGIGRGHGREHERRERHDVPTMTTSWITSRSGPVGCAMT